MTPDADAVDRPIPGALAQGAAWALFRRDGRFVVDYMSGAVAGLGGTVTVTEEEAQALKSGGEDVATRIINAHGGS